MVTNILPTDTPSTQGLGQKVKLYFFSSESSHVAYQIKADDAGCNMVDFAHIHTLDPGDGVKRSNYIFLSESSHVAYQIKGI